MTKLFQYTFLFFVMIHFASCTKEESALLDDSDVIVIPSDSDVATLGIARSDDGNCVLAGYEYRFPYDSQRNPGRMIKMDANGKIIWSKRMAEPGRTLFRILPVPGTGFLTLGIGDMDVVSSDKMDICLYDNEGTSISTHKISSHNANSWNAPFDIIRLSNGNYAVAGGSLYSKQGYLDILAPDFTVLYSRTFDALSGYTNVLFHGMCETPDGSIALTATTEFFSPAYDTTRYLSVLIRTDLDGTQKSYSLLFDSDFDETPNVITPHNNELIGFTARKPAYNAGDGAYVNYVFNYADNGLLISGKINICRFTKDGTLIERKIISDYSGNGMISSVHPTNDGGFICCGTVDQTNLPVIVSKTKIYLLKLDVNLNEEWSKTIYTTYQSFGVEALQTPDGGYLVSGQHRSMNERFEMMVIKTDANGNY